MSKAKKLRALFKKPGLIKIVGSHNGLTARLIERAGFDGIWASSLEVSASHAVPDANILTMTDYLDAAIDMNDAVSLPVVVDVDQGYGNSTNVIHMVKKFEAAGIAAVIMEEKLFPKQNSLLAGGRQKLASIAEFVGKIMAAKNAQEEMDFMVIARIEALIAGWGQEEALKRAKAYVKAGADGIMIHSKKKDPSEIIEFIEHWDEEVPLIIVPTNYYTFDEEQIKKYPKVKMVIYANHVIRTAVKAIKDTLNEIKDTGGIKTISESDRLITVQELFELQGTSEMKESEKLFLRTDSRKISALIPAAGAPNEETLKPLLKESQVCMLDINGKPLLTRVVETLNSLNIHEVNVVTGYNSDKVVVEGIKKIENPDYKSGGILKSIMAAEDYMKEDTLVVYSDIIFERSVVERLINKNEDIVLVVDSAYHELGDKSRSFELVQAKKAPKSSDRSLSLSEDNEIVKIGTNIDNATHEFIGMALFTARGIDIFKKTYHELVKTKDLSDATFSDLIQKIIEKGHKVSCLEIHKGWTEIHTFQDYKNITALIK